MKALLAVVANFPFAVTAQVSAGPGEGITWRLEYRWEWSLGVTILGILLLELVFLGMYARQSARGPMWLRIVLAQLRILAILLVFFMLSRAVLAFYRTSLPYLPIIVDDSLSMSIEDYYEPPEAAELRRAFSLPEGKTFSRWDLVQQVFTGKQAEWWQELIGRYRVRPQFLTAIGEPTTEDPRAFVELLRVRKPEGSSTKLGQAVRTLLDQFLGIPPAAVLLITDGINTEGPGLAEAARWARIRNVPLFFVAVGQTSSAPDIELRDLIAEDLVFVGDLANFSCTVETRGLENQKISVAFFPADAPRARQVLELQCPQARHQQTVSFRYRPTQVGPLKVVIEAESPPGEVNRANNRLERTITVTDQKIAVLLAAGYPSYEFRFLKNLLAREPTVALKTVLQEADPGHPEQDETALTHFPSRTEELGAFDVVILIDVNPSLLGSVGLANLSRFVDQKESERQRGGGGLVVVAGPRYLPAGLLKTPLERLLPLELAEPLSGRSEVVGRSGFRPRPTPIGLVFPGMQLADNLEENEAVWNRLPPLFWFAPMGPPKPGARVLLEHPSLLAKDNRPLPLAAFHYVGTGSVLFQAFDESWRWRWRVGDLFFGRYWIQTIRFLARGKLGSADRRVILTADRREYYFGDSVYLRLQYPEGVSYPPANVVNVLVQRGSGSPEPLPLSRSQGLMGVFEGVLATPPVGSYRVWLPEEPSPVGPPSVEFRILPPAGEFARLETDLESMQQAAATSGGAVIRPQKIRQLPDLLPRGQDLPLEMLPPRPLWNAWPVLLLFLLVLSWEWFLRKWNGMP